MGLNSFSLISATVFKSLTVACTTYHLYYTISHLDEEVEYIWNKRWTTGKVAYLLTRYLGLVFLMYSIYTTSKTFCLVTMALCSLVSISTVHNGWHKINFLSPRGPFDSCLSGHLYTGLGTMVMLLAKVILMMRVYALFGASRKLLISFITLALLLFGFNIVQLTVNLPLDIGTVPDLYLPVLVHIGCLVVPRMASVAWIVACSVELLLFLLVLWKIVRAKKKINLPICISRSKGDLPTTQDITTLMARDSIVYFAIIFSVCLLGAIIAFIREHGLTNNEFSIFLFYNQNAYFTIAVTIMTILAPKMLISLRVEYYGPEGTNTTELSWNVRVGERSDLQSVIDTVE